MNENTTNYDINIGDFTVGETVYHDRCLSASFGGSGVQSETIPWEGTENNPWDYRAEYEMVAVTHTIPVYDDNDEETSEVTEYTENEKQYTGVFVLDPIVIPLEELGITEEEQRIRDIEDALVELAGLIGG